MGCLCLPGEDESGEESEDESGESDDDEEEESNDDDDGSGSDAAWLKQVGLAAQVRW